MQRAQHAERRPGELVAKRVGLFRHAAAIGGEAQPCSSGRSRVPAVVGHQPVGHEVVDARVEPDLVHQRDAGLLRRPSSARISRRDVGRRDEMRARRRCRVRQAARASRRAASTPPRRPGRSACAPARRGRRRWMSVVRCPTAPRAFSTVRFHTTTSCPSSISRRQARGSPKGRCRTSGWSCVRSLSCGRRRSRGPGPRRRPSSLSSVSSEGRSWRGEILGAFHRQQRGQVVDRHHVERRGRRAPAPPAPASRSPRS